MTTLTRTVRFAINPPEAASSSHGDTGNGYGGRPAMRGLGRHYELDITCVGEPDAATGYLINIKHIDSAVRERAVPLLERACRERPGAEPAELLPELLAALSGAIAAPVTAVRWRLTPYYCVEMHTAAPERFLMRQQFDFAAAHRLHVDSLSDAQNREIFGRCNNPSSHGHNYRLEPVVEAELSSRGAPAMTLADLEHVTMRTLVDRFDHKNLSKDCPEFASPGGVNPTVENIARVFFQLLAPEIERQSGGRARLKALTVWETDRTSCTYEAPAQ